MAGRVTASSSCARTGRGLTAGSSGLVWDICIWLRAGREEERVLKYLETKFNINYIYINTQSVPRSKHTPSVIQTNQLML